MKADIDTIIAVIFILITGSLGDRLYIFVKEKDISRIGNGLPSLSGQNKRLVNLKMSNNNR